MKFTSLVLKNIWRHQTRTILTILGISIGIATIVVFGLITSGFEDIFSNIMKPGKTDFTVAKAGSADIILSFINDEQVDNIHNTEGVEEIVPYVMTITPLENNPYFLMAGIEADQLETSGVKITQGNAYAGNQEVIIGKITAKNKNLKVGDEINVNNNVYAISGIFESGVSFQDSGAITTITESQRLQGITDKVNLVSVVVNKGYDIKKVAEKIEQNDQELVSIIELGDFEAVDQGTKMMNSISWAISLLAVVIGAIGVMNTIIMSVFERTREIGVLRAVGWRRSRVVRMILGESLVIGVMASIVGTLLGIGVAILIMNTELGESWLVVKYEPIIFIRAFLVSVIVVMLGSLYPAYKASKLLPTEALRYE